MMGERDEKRQISYYDLLVRERGMIRERGIIRDDGRER